MQQTCRGEGTGSMKKCAPSKSSSPTATRYGNPFLSSLLPYPPLESEGIWQTGSNRCIIFLQIDKASMLDEAIEYLKTLQLQVQVH
jgi:hypothetical protein